MRTPLSLDPLMGRRQFLGLATFSGVLTSVVGCGSDDDLFWWRSEPGPFEHGVASGDPLPHRVVIWTRVTSSRAVVEVGWEISELPDFSEPLARGRVTTDESRDYTVKVDVSGLAPGETYYYRFRAERHWSPVGRTKTLPVDNVDHVRLASTSCSNFPGGYFHVYEAIAAEEVDAVVHLGDYLYEYQDGGYATSGATERGRQPMPRHETTSLADYRTRHAQYRRDTSLQACHAQHPFIVVWDDHEVANNSYRDGAKNHDSTEGPYSERRQAALQAWFEWMPVRQKRGHSIYRAFEFADLVRLSMIDTRHEARDRPYEWGDFPAKRGVDVQALNAAVNDPERTMLGEKQRRWLLDGIKGSEAKWQVIGQQTLMGRYELPEQMALNVERNDASNVEWGMQVGREVLALQERPRDSMEAHEQALLDSSIPHNLDAWDGYGFERDSIFETVAAMDKRLVVLAGDTHNAWASTLSTPESAPAGVEFGAPSVSSPGFEDAFGSSSARRIGEMMVSLIDDLRWVELTRRGYVITEYTSSAVRAQFMFVSSVKTRSYDVQQGAQVVLRDDDSFVVSEEQESEEPLITLTNHNSGSTEDATESL